MCTRKHSINCSFRFELEISNEGVATFSSKILFSRLVCLFFFFCTLESFMF